MITTHFVLIKLSYLITTVYICHYHSHADKLFIYAIPFSFIHLAITASKRHRFRFSFRLDVNIGGSSNVSHDFKWSSLEQI
jgi:hypothetical protein